MSTKSYERIGSGAQSRSETVTVRLDQRLKYLAELAARKQRRTLSSFIEWAIEESLGTVFLTDADMERDVSLKKLAADLWDCDTPDRFAKLAIFYPEMLTHTEQVLWKLVRENGALWNGWFRKDTGWYVWELKVDALRYDKLREFWDRFNKVARGELPRDTLPLWPKHKNDLPGSNEDIEF
jgi:hypothetical protein